MTSHNGSSGEGGARPSPTAVVTGAGGWLGQNLVRALAPARERVRCLVHDEAEASLLSVVGPTVDAMVGDVRDPASMDALFEGVGAAAVFHAAGVIHPLGSTKSLFDVNVGGTQLVLDRARRAGVVRFVHVSSNSPFGANPSPTDRFDEDSPYNPYMSYGQSKLEAELLVSRSFERGDLQTVILRPPWFYGPFQPARQTQFLAAVRRGRFPLVGDGTQQRSMVFTGNLVLGTPAGRDRRCRARQRVLDRRSRAIRAARGVRDRAGGVTAPKGSTCPPAVRCGSPHSWVRSPRRPTGSRRTAAATCRLPTCSAS